VLFFFCPGHHETRKKDHNSSKTQTQNKTNEKRRIENCGSDLVPARHELGFGVLEEAADVGSAEAESGNGQRNAHPHGGRQVPPLGRVIARPYRCEPNTLRYYTTRTTGTAKSHWGLRQSNNLLVKTIAKLETYRTYGIDTSRDKSRDFDLVSLTS
jgi:hypothetical protein